MGVQPRIVTATFSEAQAGLLRQTAEYLASGKSVKGTSLEPLEILSGREVSYSDMAALLVACNMLQLQRDGILTGVAQDLLTREIERVSGKANIGR